MPSRNFHHLDINKLFEEHSVKDIEQIQKTIQHESDRKKIELRTLVGERYRDLIQAADTIAEMRQTSRNVILRIADVETTFRDLQQKYLIGFKIDTNESNGERDLRSVSDSVVMQIKILMDIPEHIWSAIDNRDLLLASQLFILAQHVNYSLTFEVGQTILTNKYPIVAKQWSVIGHFRNVIFGECNDTLRSLDLSAEVAANCLAALVLLDGTTSKDLLEKLIYLRCQAIESIINDESPHGVRQRIKLSVKLLTDTVVLIHSCFIKINDRSRGMVANYVKNLTNQLASEMLYRLDLDNVLLKKFLPTVTKSHKLFVNDDFNDISTDELSKILENWLRWIEKFTSIEISRLLGLVTSVRGIYNIREESLALLLPSNWNEITDDLSIARKTFWSLYYQALLTKRVKTIIREKLFNCLVSMEHDIDDTLLIILTSRRINETEADLRWYVWKDSNDDIPEKLSKNNTPETRKMLLMKSRAFSPNILKICENFDINLSIILNDLAQYLDEETDNRDNFMSIDCGEIFEKSNDRREIQENLSDLGAIMFQELVIFLRDKYAREKKNNYNDDELAKEEKEEERKKEEENDDEDKEILANNNETNFIFLARFYQALTLLCPNFAKIFTIARSKVSSSVTAASSSCCARWQDICERSRDESTKFWLEWSKIWSKRLSRESVKFFNNYSTWTSDVDGLVNEWERVTIEEEAEEGKFMKSEIFVPHRASARMENFLSNVTRELNRVIPHTLPKKVMNEIIDNIANVLFDNYDATSKNSNIRQKQAFQILFDIKYITLLMVPRENKILTERSVKVTNNVLAKIDPFDSDVFYPFIHANVKKSVQRTLLIFGNLVPHIEQLHSVLGSRSDYASSDVTKPIIDPPGGLAVCTGAPWFPPLAVTAPTRNLPLMTVSIPDKTPRKKTPVKEAPKNDFSGATIKSGAAAFFGAMGSDWFGTS